MESPASSYALSLSDTSVSNLGSRAPSPATVVQATNPELNTGAPPKCKGLPLFESGDGDMRISVNGTCFETHKYLIKRFQALKALLDNQSQELAIQRNDISAEDFCEMFKVLYASVIMGPPTFASETLVSALRVATLYKYPALRDYCVQHLETLKLDAVKRIEIAHEFHLLDWEKPAYHELGMRDEPITREEAKIIGLDALVIIAEMREKEQRRRGKEIDAVCDRQAGGYPELSAPAGQAITLPQVDNTSEQLHQNAPSEEPSCAHSAPLGDGSEVGNAKTCLDSGAEMGPSFVGIELNGTYSWKRGLGYGVEVPDCKCHFIDNGKSMDRKCALPACAVSAIKGIQAQQAAHANSIANLESTVKKLGTPAPVSSVPAPPLLRRFNCGPHLRSYAPPRFPVHTNAAIGSE